MQNAHERAGENLHACVRKGVAGVSDGQRIGKLHFSYDWEVDAALILLDNDDVPDTDILLKEKVFVLEEKHEKEKLLVVIDSYVQQKKVEGTLVNYNINERLITFVEGQGNKMKNLFSVSNNGAPMTEPGDSGAWIKTVDGKVIGMVVGASVTRTYGVKMSTIFEKLNLL